MDPFSSFAGNDRFEVSAVLGEGSTGRVYRVLDRTTSRQVALKTLRLPPVEALYRLKREFRARADIAHPNLLQFHELFVDDSHCFFTMEAVEGVDFLHWVRGDLGLRGMHGSTVEDSLGSIEDLRPPSNTASASVAPPAESFFSSKPSPSTPETPRSWATLRRGLDQLLQGLQALHSEGLVHRDVKPSNVLVTPQGRFVLLDFGLATELHGSSAGPQRPLRPAGTPTYMAPEQVSGGPLEPAADLYAVGAMLYEALAGFPPFSDLGGNILEHKLHLQPRLLDELAPKAPMDLRQLAMEMLATAPSQRPTAASCRQRLGLASSEPLPRAPAPGPHSLFVGRGSELGTLTQALEEVALERHPVTVHLHGPSGIGKSKLVRQFLTLQESALRPVVLQGRCHAQESIPYKALDACIDGLARYLASLPAAEAAALTPPKASALARLFPVLGRLSSFQNAPNPSLLPEAVELRRQGAQALREVLDRLARGPRPLVLWIDDVQWGDADSTPLFEELLRPPAPPLLLVLSWRSEDGQASPLLHRLRELTRSTPDAPSRVRELVLQGLQPSEVDALATALLGASGAAAQVQAVVAQSEGNPFIARELARHAGASVDWGTPGAQAPRVDLARLVLERIQALPEQERSLVEVAALVSHPLALSVALRASGLGKEGLERLAPLRGSGLLREVPGKKETSLGAYHDLIREALLGALPADVRAQRHRSIAEALTEARSEDDDALLLHWEGAGETVKAGHHAVRSADRAAQALAFEHAARLYRKGLELLGEQAERPTLLERQAEALANLGRAEEAARHYLEAAQALGGVLSQLRVRDLQRRAAEQYLKSGRFSEGWREMKPVLQALGVPIPGSFFSAVWAATWRRLLFLARGMGNGSPSPEALAPEEQQRLEVLWSACTSWTIQNPMLSDAFRTMHLLGARRLGDSTAHNRALVLESVMELHMGGRLMNASAQKLLGRVRPRLEGSGAPYDRAWYELAKVNVGYTSGRWRDVVEAGEHAEALFREHCPGSGWERGTVAIFHHHAMAMRGELRRLATRLEGFRREAQERGDLLALGEPYVGEPVVVWLAQDRADEARARARESLAAQSASTPTWPENAYRRQQFVDLIAAVYTAHYRGEPWPAWRAVLEQWEALRASFMLTLRTTGLNLRHMRARAALAAAATLKDGSTPLPEQAPPRSSRKALLSDVQEQVRIIEKDPLGCARPIGSLLRAGLAWQESRVTEARQRLEQAIAGFEREDMALYREAARYALSTLHEGSPGAALRRQAEEWMEGEGVVRPGALAAALVPGIAAWPEAARAQRP